MSARIQRSSLPRIEAGSVPDTLAEYAHRAYERMYGPGPDLRRINKRGGFDWIELCSLVSLQRAADDESFKRWLVAELECLSVDLPCPHGLQACPKCDPCDCDREEGR